MTHSVLTYFTLPSDLLIKSMGNPGFVWRPHRYAPIYIYYQSKHPAPKVNGFNSIGLESNETHEQLRTRKFVISVWQRNKNSHATSICIPIPSSIQYTHSRFYYVSAWLPLNTAQCRCVLLTNKAPVRQRYIQVCNDHYCTSQSPITCIWITRLQDFVNKVNELESFEQTLMFCHSVD